VYRAGQVLTVYYSPQNLSYAQLDRPRPPTAGGLPDGFYLCAAFALIFLVAAAINLAVLVHERRRLRGGPVSHYLAVP